MANIIERLRGIFRETPEEHPLLKARKERERVHKYAFGITYAPDGTPKIEADWVEKLAPAVRTHVDNILLAKGWKINLENKAERT